MWNSLKHCFHSGFYFCQERLYAYRENSPSPGPYAEGGQEMNGRPVKGLLGHKQGSGV